MDVKTEPSQQASDKDRLFAAPGPVSDFEFGERTAAVFDDMLDRSVPMYGEIQRMSAQLACDFAAEGSSIYDLGCSTCTTLLAIDRLLPPERPVRFVGVDSSAPMLEKARKKLTAAGTKRDYDLRLGDLNEGVAIANASVVTLILTLQFVRPLHRDGLLSSIHRGLNDQGCVILVEKVLGESSTYNRLFIEHYYEMKRANGYSELEIAKKREALENVLIPYRLEENRELLKRCGFRNIDVFFKWYCFCGIIAMK